MNEIEQMLHDTYIEMAQDEQLAASLALARSDYSGARMAATRAQRYTMEAGKLEIPLDAAEQKTIASRREARDWSYG
jgi:hypothetical protein